MHNTSRYLSTSLLFLLLSVFALGGCGNEVPPAVMGVSFMELTEGSVELTSELPGRISAYYVSEVRPQVGGILLKRFFTEGTMVKEGDVLYQIDPSLYQASYDSAQANLARAQAAAYAKELLAKRYSALVKTTAVSKQDYDNSMADYKSAAADVLAAEAALEEAGINLRYTRVTAPITGRIGRSSVTEGALVIQNQVNALALIQQMDKMYLDVSQSSFEVMDMQRRFGGKPKNDVQLKFQDGSIYSSKGVLEFYDVTVDQSTDTVNVRILFPNPEGLLLPGMYGRAIVLEGVDNKAILIPQKIISKGTKNSDVVKVLTKEVKKDKDGIEAETGLYTVSLRSIRTGGVFDVNKVYVTEGLAKGELLLVEGQQKVQPGDVVKVEPASEAVLWGGAAAVNGKEPSEEPSKEEPVKKSIGE